MRRRRWYDAAACTEWLDGFLTQGGFWGRAQETVMRSFELGTGAFAIWIDTAMRSVCIRHYDAEDGGAAFLGRRGGARVRVRDACLR